MHECLQLERICKKSRFRASKVTYTFSPELRLRGRENADESARLALVAIRSSTLFAEKPLSLLAGDSARRLSGWHVLCDPRPSTEAYESAPSQSYAQLVCGDGGAAFAYTSEGSENEAAGVESSSDEIQPPLRF